MTADAAAREKALRQLRMDHAFGHMLAAVLVGAGASAGGALLVGIVELAAAGAFGLSGGLAAIFRALTIGFLSFLVGFGAAAAVFAPLYAGLESRRIRRRTPYLIAGAVVGYFGGWALTGRLPSYDAPLGLFGMAPGLLVAWLFLRRVAPHWRTLDIIDELEIDAARLTFPSARRDH